MQVSHQICSKSMMFLHSHLLDDSHNLKTLKFFLKILNGSMRLLILIGQIQKRKQRKLFSFCILFCQKQRIFHLFSFEDIVFKSLNREPYYYFKKTLSTVTIKSRKDSNRFFFSIRKFMNR